MKNGLRKKVASIATSAAMLSSVAAYNAEAVLADDELDTENTPAIENEQVSENNDLKVFMLLKKKHTIRLQKKKRNIKIRVMKILNQILLRLKLKKKLVM